MVSIKNDTNKKIIDLVGDYNDYLTTCFCLQNSKNTNFIDMTQLQKKEYLNEILKLDIFQNCYDFARAKFKKMSNQLKIFEDKIQKTSLNEIKNKIKSKMSEVQHLEKKKSFINDLIENLNFGLSKLSNIELIKYDELSEYHLTSEKDISNAIEIIKDKLSSIDNFPVDELRMKISRLKNDLIEIQKSQKSIDVYQLMSNKETIMKKNSKHSR